MWIVPENSTFCLLFTASCKTLVNIDALLGKWSCPLWHQKGLRYRDYQCSWKTTDKHFSQVVAQDKVGTSSSEVLNSQRFDFVPTVVNFTLEYLNAVVNRLKKLKSLLDLVWNSLSSPRHPCLLIVYHPPLVSWGRLWAMEHFDRQHANI